MIFELVLVVQHEIKILPSAVDGKLFEKPADETPEPHGNLGALLRVSKRTYAETVGILYGRNTFAFSTGIVKGFNGTALTTFINSVAEADLVYIRRITISPYLPRRAWSNSPARERERGGLEMEFDRMVRAVVKYLAGVEEMEIDLDGPYGPPVLRRPAVVVNRRAENVRVVKRVVRALRKREGMRISIRAGRWLDLELIQGELRRKNLV
jgi:hypothetical protein